MTDKLIKQIKEEQKEGPIEENVAVVSGEYLNDMEARILADADRIKELEAENARLERANEALEQLRPVWAQGWTEDSMAAQASSSALSELWEMLGAGNQTQAVSTLAALAEQEKDDE